MIKYNSKKSGMTLMELLVVIVIIGILVTFGMVAIKLMSRDYVQRKMPQSIYTNLKAINAEILVRNPQEKRSGFNDTSVYNQGLAVDVAESFIPGEKKLPFEGNAYCEAFRRIANTTRNRFSCAQTRTVNGSAQTGGGDIGNEMYIIGLNNPIINCWDGRRCRRVYVSIKQDPNDNPLFLTPGRINQKGDIVGVVDHFGFNIYENGDVEPMITAVSTQDGSTVTPYGVAADMVTVDVIVDSVDDIYRNKQVLLSQVINHAINQCADCDVRNTTRGDEPLFFHNTDTLNYFVTEKGGDKTAKNVPSTSLNFVDPVMQNTGNGTFCEYGMACRVGFEDNDVPIVAADENGATQAAIISIPDYRQKQMNDANVLLFKIPYRRALAIKNRVEWMSFHTHHITAVTKAVGCGVDTCAERQNGVDTFEQKSCIARRLVDINDDDRRYIEDRSFDLSISNANNYCSNGHGSDSPANSAANAARKRRICRLVDISLR